MTQSTLETSPPATRRRTLRVCMALPGLHQVNRGAETAFENIAVELSKLGHDVTLIGSGAAIPGRPYRFIHAGSLPRTWFTRMPRMPFLRNHYAYEELSFAPALWLKFKPQDFDLSLTCGFPYCNWVLRRGRDHPPHVFVTQNGDHMATARQIDFRQFACDGLVCTNQEYFARNEKNYRCTLIPNGVDPARFSPGSDLRKAMDLPATGPIALMVSALIPSKRVEAGIRAVAATRDICLVVAGDGELARPIDALGQALLGARYRRLVLPRERMPDLYRSVDLFLHASLIEASANAYMEALATGLPIVTHDWAVTRWTLEETSVLVDANDITQLARGMEQALMSIGPKQVANRRGLVERRFAWSSIAKRYESFFEQVLSATGRGA